MALIVETGTGSTTAESYISEANADIYFANRGNIAWDSVADKEAALRKATDYMIGEYRDRWAGYRKTTTQRLDWPRSLVPIKDSASAYGGTADYYDESSVPEAVAFACASLALRTATADLLADQSRVKLSVTVGPISTTYDQYSSDAVQYKEIEAMLAPYLKSRRNQINLVRI